MNNVELGKHGENLACEYLIKNGFEIIERNVKFSRFCELDIIAKEKNTLVFVEVKTRKTDFCGSPLEAITKKKFQNIKTGVMHYLAQSSVKFSAYRIDAIALTLNPKLEIMHIKNIYL